MADERDFLTRMQQNLLRLQAEQSSIVRMKEGYNRFRVLPSWRGDYDDNYYLRVETHYEVSSTVKALLCPQMVGEPCPVCKRVERLSLGDSTQQERAERMGAKAQYMMNIVPVSEGPIGQRPTPLEPAVKIFGASYGVIRTLTGFFMDPDYENFIHPEHGYDTVITRTGKDLSTKYEVRLAKSPTTIRLDGWREHMVNLDAKFKPKSQEEIREILGIKPSGNGRRPDRPHMEGEDESPVRKKKRLVSSRPESVRPRSEDYDDDIPF